MKYYIEMLDWRASSFKHVRHILGLSLSEVLGMLDGSYHMDDLIDSEIVDSDLPIKRILAYLYNELLISRPIYFGFGEKLSHAFRVCKLQEIIPKTGGIKPLRGRKKSLKTQISASIFC